MKGWFRRCVKVINKVEVQCILWKDSKLVGFITTAWICALSAADVVHRTTKNIPRPSIVNYLANYGGVDRADRDIDDFSTAYQSNRWHTRVFFWLLDVTLWNV